MSPNKNRHSSFPEPDDERPSALSADGLTVGPLLGEDGEDMGTYPFAGPLSDAPPGLVLPLVAGFAGAVSPGGRWRRRALAIQAAGALRAFVREIVKLYPGLDAIEDLSPEMYRGWFWEVGSGAVWPGRIVIVRVLLEETDGVLQTVRTLKASKPDHGASKPYTRSEFRRIRSALRATAFAGHARTARNFEHMAVYRAGEEPDDASRWQLMDEVLSKGEFLDHLAHARAS